jgi:hypothetical protein
MDLHDMDEHLHGRRLASTSPARGHALGTSRTKLGGRRQGTPSIYVPRQLPPCPVFLKFIKLIAESGLDISATPPPQPLVEKRKNPHRRAQPHPHEKDESIDESARDALAPEVPSLLSPTLAYSAERDILIAWQRGALAPRLGVCAKKDEAHRMLHMRLDELHQRLIPQAEKEQAERQNIQ